ncbi:uncharacterized protein LOC100881200 [Megachile rotundata]|uniref:uncharacterized protein LOC100881200 n=1 Tax=Megachile rotundata TaxID=143995 RepID=UPI000258E0B3|nr:PREDICTED: zinc finger protein 700-like [Megachile rotundata]
MNECRLCLRVQARLTSIFSKGEASERLRSRILDCCPVTLFEDDRLPKAVCEQCRKKLTIAYEFRERCRRSELALRSRYESPYWRKSNGLDRVLLQDRAVQTDIEIRPKENNRNEIEYKEKEVEPKEIEIESKNHETSFQQEGRTLATAKEGESEPSRVETWRFEDHLIDETEISNPTNLPLKQQTINTQNNTQNKKDQSVPESVEATEKRYLCDVCSKTFVSKSGLRFHLKSHNGAKPYQCGHCGKGFAIPSYAKRHERIHAGEKRFVCHVCSATFASSNGLKYHLRSHTGEANYRCDICGKSFYRRKYLIEHGYTHTGEKPFVCKTCGSCYGNSGSLFVHEKRCRVRGTEGEVQRRR